MTESNTDRTLEKFTSQEYAYGFKTDIETDQLEPGLSEEVIRTISKKKDEPQYMLDWRLKAFEKWQKMTEPDCCLLYTSPSPRDS